MLWTSCIHQSIKAQERLIIVDRGIDHEVANCCFLVIIPFGVLLMVSSTPAVRIFLHSNTCYMVVQNTPQFPSSHACQGSVIQFVKPTLIPSKPIPQFISLLMLRKTPISSWLSELEETVRAIMVTSNLRRTHRMPLHALCSPQYAAYMSQLHVKRYPSGWILVVIILSLLCIFPSRMVDLFLRAQVIISLFVVLIWVTAEQLRASQYRFLIPKARFRFLFPEKEWNKCLAQSS